jgi:hypothetical protein
MCGRTEGLNELAMGCSIEIGEAVRHRMVIRGVILIAVLKKMHRNLECGIAFVSRNSETTSQNAVLFMISGSRRGSKTQLDMKTFCKYREIGRGRLQAFHRISRLSTSWIIGKYFCNLLSQGIQR